MILNRTITMCKEPLKSPHFLEQKWNMFAAYINSLLKANWTLQIFITSNCLQTSSSVSPFPVLRNHPIRRYSVYHFTLYCTAQMSTGRRGDWLQPAKRN